jgi:hypothetical protein
VNRTLLLLLSVIVFVGAIASTEVLAFDFPNPPKSTITEVSENTSTFGITMQIRRFESQLSQEDIIDFYNQHWKDTAAITLFDPWEMIGKVEHKKFVNVQVQNGFSGSWGYLTISDLPTAIKKDRLRVPDGSDFPSMSGSRVLGEQHYNDATKTARTLLLNNDFSTASNGNFYRNHYQSQGWQLVADTRGSRLKGEAMTFSKGRQILSLTINEFKSGTSVVANIETAKIFK